MFDRLYISHLIFGTVLYSNMYVTSFRSMDILLLMAFGGDVGLVTSACL